MDETPDPFSPGTAAVPEPVSFLSASTPSAVYFKDTKTLKVSISAVVEQSTIKSIHLIRDKHFKTGIKFTVLAMPRAGAVPGAPAEKMTATGKTQIEIPTGTPNFDDKKVIITATAETTKTYSAAITHSAVPDPDAPKPPPPAGAKPDTKQVV